MRLRLVPPRLPDPERLDAERRAVEDFAEDDFVERADVLRAAPPLAPLARAAAAFFGVRVLPAFEAACERVILPPLRLDVAFFVTPALRVEEAGLARLEVLRVERAVLALRVEAPVFRVEEDEEALRVPALFRPPLAAAAVRPAAPREDFAVLALRVEEPALRVEVEDAFFAPPLLRPPLAAAAVRPAAPRAEVDLRAEDAFRVELRRFGFSSVCGCCMPSSFSCPSGMSFMLSLMRLSPLRGS
jgi:hypothetical protein